MIYRIHNLSFDYGDKPVLTNISLDFEEGFFYGILGPNGCGKTTLLDLLVNHLKPVSGDIIYKRKSVSDYSGKALAKEVALVAQSYAINFPYQVKDIVMMGRHPYIRRFSSPSNYDEDVVHDVMEKADISRFSNRLVTELSGGERQRVVFARALAQETPVLILDEATSNLDIHHTITLLNCVRKGIDEDSKTVIAVFHDINLAALYCDRLVFMKEGKVLVSGDVNSVLDESVVQDVFHVDSKVRDDAFSGARQVVFRRHLNISNAEELL